MSKELPSRINNFFHFTTLNGLSNILSTRCIAAVSHLADDSKGERVERDKLEKEFGNLIPKAEFESFDLAQLVPEVQSFFQKGYDTVIGQLADRLRNFPVCFTQFASMRFLAHFGNFAVEVKDPPHLKPVVYKSTKEILDLLYRMSCAKGQEDIWTIQHEKFEWQKEWRIPDSRKENCLHLNFESGIGSIQSIWLPAPGEKHGAHRFDPNFACEYYEITIPSELKEKIKIYCGTEQ